MADQGSFSADVSKWVRQSEQRLEAVFRDSAQTLSEEVKKPRAAGGNMPVDTGFLRASMQASNTEMPKIDKEVTPEENATYPENSEQVELLIAGSKLGQTIYLGFTAAYARRLEYGFKGKDKLGREYNQEGYGFVRLAAQKWQRIVRASSAKIKAAVVARKSAGR